MHLYIHVPFCSRRCSYCDFAIAVRRTVPVSAYLEALAHELEIRLKNTPVRPLSTVYLGGGTPSKLGAAGVAELLDRLRAFPQLPLEAGAEVTIEANPEDVTPDAALAWARAGVNRLSIGVQSFHPAVLTWMHRTHDASAAARAVDTARAAGISNLSLDLIFALPTELGRDWERDLLTAIGLKPDHISLYGLTVEPHTPLGRWTARGAVSEAPEERYAAEYLTANTLLSSVGFEHYEVSNFARAGCSSRHNSSYWQRTPYIGLGPSAHSFDGASRRWNAREYEGWREMLAAGADPIGGSESLTAQDVVSEVVYLGLRTNRGLASSPADSEMVRAWRANGWAKERDGRIILTTEGWLRLDTLAAALTAVRSR